MKYIFSSCAEHSGHLFSLLRLKVKNSAGRAKHILQLHNHQKIGLKRRRGPIEQLSVQEEPGDAFWPGHLDKSNTL